MLVEICANSYRSAVNAAKSGADRIELCSELGVGGVTPSYGLIKKVLDDIDIPVHVLVRPRSGNFTYAEEEVDVILEDIAMCASLGCKGVVSGALNKDFTIDLAVLNKMLEKASGLDFTFHRAFDWVVNAEVATEQLIEAGCSRVLSSGQQNSADKGLALLTKLHKKYGENITLMPGGGVKPDNILKFQELGFREIHFSGTKPVKILDSNPGISFLSEVVTPETHVLESDPEYIKQMLYLVK